MTRAERFGTRERAVGPWLENWLQMQRSVVDLTGQTDAVLLAEEALELGPIDTLGRYVPVPTVGFGQKESFVLQTFKSWSRSHAGNYDGWDISESLTVQPAR